MRDSQFLELTKMAATDWPRVEVATGEKSKRGKRARVLELLGRRSLLIEIAGRKPFTVSYAEVDIVGADGKVVIVPVTDMSGRKLSEGAWVVYSVTHGRHYQHSLEIGRVTRINGTGTLRVKPMIRDGEKIDDPSPLGITDKLVSNPLRCLKLPVDVPTLTMWILKDFEGIAPDPLDEGSDGQKA